MRRRWRLPRTSLAVRITATFALGALLLSVGLAISGDWFTLNLLTGQHERDAQRQSYLNAALARDQLQAVNPDVPAILDSLTTPAGSDAVIYTGGRWYSSSLLISRNTVPDSIRRNTLAGNVVWQWLDITGKPSLVVGVPLRGAHSAYFQFFDQSPLRRTRDVLTTVLIIAASAATIAGALVGYLVSRRLTAPLRQLGHATQRITAGELALRLPVSRDTELAQLVRNFNQMVDTLAARIDRDARFTADVSHELRSPLTTLSTALSVLSARSGELSAAGRDALTLLTAEAARFSRLVDDLLEMSRSDADDEREPVRLGQLLLNLLERPRYAGVRAELGADALEAFVLADKRKLEQVLANLLDNAAAYAGGATRVGFQVAADRVTICVDDAGPGIPVEDRERIFDRFTRGRAAARGSRTGTGLGLALVRQHVSQHGGTITVSDAPGGGARFTVELPRWMP